MLSDKVLKQLINEKVISCKLINKGWSDDEKFLVSTYYKLYLVRRSKIAVYEEKLVEFEYMQKAFATGINMQKPLMIKKDLQYVYILLPYIKGRDLEECLPSLDKKAQYDYGYESGIIVKKIHSISAKEKCEPWFDHFSKKVIRNIKRYKECEISFEGSEYMIEFLINHLNILKGRPQTFMHGDYHVGNMLIDEHNKLAVIDFNRMDFGDPYEEFNRLIAFTRTASISFARGQIHGYFNKQVPDEFFTYLAFYTASNTIGSISWAISFGQDEINVMLKSAETVLSDFQNFTKMKPAWYM